MKVDRETLLKSLESVGPGLAVKEYVVEQSSCFVFQDGRVKTFNDEVFCSAPCDIGIEGAVAAKPLVELLSRLAEQEIDISSTDGNELLVKGKRRRAGIRCEAAITLPVVSVEEPGEWNDLNPEFSDAIGIVQHCASRDPNRFHLTCVHVTPDFVETCDNFQVVRYPLRTGIRTSCLVRAESMKHVVSVGATQVSETKTWLHFSNTTGLVFSVRREMMDYPDLQEILDTKGTPITLPGGLADAVKKAQIFSAENSEHNVVSIGLHPDHMRLKGVGASGWYEERKELKWDGEPLMFTISPGLLIDIVAKSHDCYVIPSRLKIDGGKFVYVTVLGVAS